MKSTSLAALCSLVTLAALCSLITLATACDRTLDLEGMAQDGGTDASAGDGGPFSGPEPEFHNADASVVPSPQPLDPSFPDSGVVGRPIDPIGCTDLTEDARLLAARPCRGPLVWQKQLTNGEPQEGVIDVATDAAGNIYWMQTLFGHFDLGGEEIGGPSGKTALLVSYTREGVMRWIFRHADVNADAMALAPGQVCVALSGNGVRSGLPAPLDGDVGGLDAIVCMTTDGEPRWSRHVDSGITSIRDMTADAHGNLYVAGSYQDTLVISDSMMAPGYDAPGTGTKGDAFVVSYTPDGGPRWLATLGSPARDDANSVAVDSEGGVFLVGTDEGGVRTGDQELSELSPLPLTADAPLRAGFIVKLDAQGALVWAKRTTEEETFGPERTVIDARGRAIVSFAHSQTVVAYHADGEVEDVEGRVPGSGHPLVAYDDGFVVFGTCESSDIGTLVPCLVDADLDFVPRSTRALVRVGADDSTITGLVAVARMRDGSVVVASDWADVITRHLVLLAPPAP